MGLLYQVKYQVHSIMRVTLQAFNVIQPLRYQPRYIIGTCICPKNKSIFVKSDRHIHLLVRIRLGKQVETNPYPLNLDDSSYQCLICSRDCTCDSDAIV